MQSCPRCGERRVLRADQNLCGMCVRRARPRKEPTPRVCERCGRLAKHAAHGLCSACYQRTKTSVTGWTDAAVLRLGAPVPDWFEAMAEDIGDRFVSGAALRHLRRIEHQMTQGARTPDALVHALRSPGRSPGDTARAVDEYFTSVGHGSFLQDEENRRSAGRRDRRVARTPLPLRPAVASFREYLLSSRTRAVLVGGRGLLDGTIEARLADVAVLGNFLERRGVNDWSAVAAGDIDEFLGSKPRLRLASLRMFFAFARRRKLILVNPTAGLRYPRPRGFAGRTLDNAEQRRLVQRWMRTSVDPRERAVGLLALLHAMTSSQIRALLVSDINCRNATMTIAGRPYQVPLDPITSAAIDAVLDARTALRTNNPHLILTKDSRAHETASSAYFMTHVLDPAGVTPAVLRQTRLADLAHSHDPRLVAAAFGMTAGAALHYTFDAVDREGEAFTPTRED